MVVGIRKWIPSQDDHSYSQSSRLEKKKAENKIVTNELKRIKTGLSS